MKTRRETAGSYTVSDGDLAVTVTRQDHLHGWIAAANWDRYLYTDPVPTKKAAVAEARRMIEGAK